MRDFASLQTDGRLGAIASDGRWMQRRAMEACLALALSPAFAWVRPFGVDEQTFLARLGYWGGVLVCWFMAMAVAESLLANMRFFRGLALVTRRIVVIGLAAVPMLFIAGAATHALTGWQASVSEVSELYGQIVVLGSMVALLAKAVLPHGAEPVPSAEAVRSFELSRPVPAVIDSPAVPSPLVARLPAAVRGRIVCLEMEDHYVRVHTDHGSALVLLRLSDAIAEACPAQGQQVHRSWWVSDEAVEGFERVGRVGAVVLSNGVRAPVSQRYLRSVEASFA